jgi:hypothetical protein
MAPEDLRELEDLSRDMQDGGFMQLISQEKAKIAADPTKKRKRQTNPQQ